MLRDELITPASRALASSGGDHPVLGGKLLRDYGYKKVLSCSARRLVRAVPIWHRQRPVNEKRVEVRRTPRRLPAA